MEISSQLRVSAPADRRVEALGDFRVLPDELICAILDLLTPHDVARLACVSSVMYIFCNEEPLWMNLCLRNPTLPFQFRDSWKKTTLYSENVPVQYIESCGKPLQFDGFTSVFLYRRFYRCFTSLKQFSFDDGNVERREGLSAEEFSRQYDGKKPVLLAGFADTWPASKTWTIDQLSASYGDTTFRISQRSPVKVSMKLKDYVSYMKLQHDEDPLYIFDDDFGEAAPPLLKDYCVPHLFQEDFFDVMDSDSRPPYRWLIIGPERSGASWHVDPALTSAWNTLLCGRKRWALYPPGRVPLGVTVNVNDDDGDVHIDTPSSLQWWLDFYPLLAKEDRPIECTQLPGETIFVPSGWWHCVLNLEPTVAVTQNFVNFKNFEFVCLDMAPGYCHKGVCRAGLFALDHGTVETMKSIAGSDNDILSYSDFTRKEKRIKGLRSEEDVDRSDQEMHDAALRNDNLWGTFSYDINYLAMFLDKEKDHYTSPWSMGNPVGPREVRQWLCRLWFRKPEMRELLWKGACLLLNADKWLDRLRAICLFHNLPAATEDQKLPVGTGSNPVYVMDDYVVKIFAEEGLECSVYCLGTELEFFNVVHKMDSPLKTHIPEIVASGVLYSENGSHKIELWEDKEIPEVIRNCNLLSEDCAKLDFPFGLWSRTQFECRKAKSLASVSNCTDVSTKVWPYIISRRCKGKLFAEIRDAVSKEDVLNLASFLGEQLRNLHLLPYTSSVTPISADAERRVELSLSKGTEFSSDELAIPTEWKTFIRTLRWKKEGIVSRLTKWGHPIPKLLIQKVNDYIPDDFCKFLCIDADENGIRTVGKHFSWIHSDIMDDNIYMEPCSSKSCSYGLGNNSMNGSKEHEGKSWQPSYIIDFSNLSAGDSIYDLIPMYLDVFRGDACLFKEFLRNYKLHFFKRVPEHGSVNVTEKFQRPSYHAMCYCILHEDNVLGAIFSIWKELRTAKSWEEVELTVWAELNNYELSCSS